MGRAVLLHSADGVVATCEPSVLVLRGAAILVRDGAIVELGNSEALRARYGGAAAPGAEQQPERGGGEGEGNEEGGEVELVDLKGRWIIPGEPGCPTFSDCALTELHCTVPYCGELRIFIPISSPFGWWRGTQCSSACPQHPSA